MSLNYDPAANLTHYPISMAKYGQNPYGDNLYRIVSTASRRNLVGGTWGDNGATEYRWKRTYAYISEPWVMERWDTCRMTRARWDAMVDPQSGWLLNGPYPDRGEYYWCHTFTCGIVDANLDKLVSWIEAGQKRTYQENQDACRQEYDAETAERKGRMNDIILNALPAFLDSPMVGFGGGRGTKTAPIILGARDVRLPRGRKAPVGVNKFVTVPRRRRRVA